MLHEHLDEPEEAAAGYLDAANHWREFTHLHYQADGLLGAARCYGLLGDQERARGALAQARRLYDAMPAAGKVAECDDLLATLN
jgi:hypothetical protein